LLILYNLIVIQFIDSSILELKPQRSPYLGILQFSIFGFFSLASFYLGQFIIRKKIFSISSILSLIIISFVFPLIFGLIFGLRDGDMPRILFFFREILTSDTYPSGYLDRNAMLTAEPSWASIDICLIIIPVALILAKFKPKSLIFVSFIILLALINLLFTKSVTGILLMIVSLVPIVNFKKIGQIRYFAPLFLIILIVWFLTDESLVPLYERLLRLLTSINSSDNNLEASGLSRIIFYDIFFKTVLQHPFGIGYSNEGYFYAYYMDTQFKNIPLIYDLAFDPNGRFADFKNFFMKIISNFGVIGLFITIKFCKWLIALLKKCPANIKPFFKSMLFVFITASFTFNYIGYFTITFLMGIISYYIQSEYENIDINTKNTLSTYSGGQKNCI
jgi:hypothetical protein